MALIGYSMGGSFGRQSSPAFMQALLGQQQLPMDQFGRQNALLGALGLNMSTRRSIQSNPRVLGGSGTPTIKRTQSAKLDPDSFLGKMFGGFGLSQQDGEDAGQSSRLKDMQDLLSQLSGYGESQRTDIGRRFDAARNTELSRLEDRGLGASTIGSVAVSDVEARRDQSLRSLEDTLTGERVGLQERFLEGSYDERERALDRAQRDRAMQQQLLTSLLGGLLR